MRSIVFRAQNWIDRDDRIIISFDFAPTLLPRKSEVKELPSVLGVSDLPGLLIISLLICRPIQIMS